MKILSCNGEFFGFVGPQLRVVIKTLTRGAFQFTVLGNGGTYDLGDFTGLRMVNLFDRLVHKQPETVSAWLELLTELGGVRK